MNNNRFVTYTEDDRAIVRQGIEAIKQVLLGNDADRKRSMLFCLDWFMDPYYGQDISDIKEGLIKLLQQVIISRDNEKDIKNDALGLLMDYEWGPFPILEKHFDELEEELKPDARYVCNMHLDNKDKRIIFLGSSVTYGEASGGISFVEELGRRNGYQTYKEAVSGTTLVDEGPDSYVSRMKRIRLDSADLFVCQLSTNDATCQKPLGKVGQDTEMESFDVKTVAGAIEYIIAYVLKKWGCRILFYTSPRYESKEYDQMVKLLKNVACKWNIEILDLWNDKEFNAISSDDRTRFMADVIHPTFEGYQEWWTPKFENAVRELI